MDPRPRQNRAAVILSVTSNAILTIMKLIVGLLTGSVAVLSEAANSAGDLLASGIAFAGVRAAARPADEDHPYGHEKSENLAAAIEGALMLIAGTAVAIEAVRRLISGAQVITDVNLAIAVMTAAAIVNVAVSARLRAVAGRTGSPAVEGEAAHLSSDVWTSAGTAAGLLLVAVTGWEWLDAVIGLLVAAYVIWVGGRLLWRGVQVLLDRALPDDERDVIEGVLTGFAVDGVSFHALRGRRAGSKRHVDLHMVMPPETTVRNGHLMSGRVKGALRAALPDTDVLIHIEDREREGAEGVGRPVANLSRDEHSSTHGRA